MVGRADPNAELTGGWFENGSIVHTRGMKAFSVIFLIVGLGLFGGAGYFVKDTLDFLDSSTQTRATVIGLAATRNQAAGKSASYRPVYSFKVGGKTITAESDGPYSSPAPSIGDEHDVRYKTADPQDVRKDSLFGLWLAPIILVPIGIPFFLIGLWAMARSRRAGETQAQVEQLIATGAPAIGTLLDIREGTVRVSTGNSARRVRVKLRFRIEPLDGSPAFEDEKATFIEVIGAPQKGARYPVFYDRSEPKRWAWVTHVDTEQGRRDIVHKFGDAFGTDASGIGMVGVGQPLTKA